MSKGSPLVIRSGNPSEVLGSLVFETGAAAVFWNERYEPDVRLRDRDISEYLQAKGVEVRRFHGHLLFDPDRLWNGKQEPYKVFTSFWKRCMHEAVPPAVGVPDRLEGIGDVVESLTVERLGLLPQEEVDFGEYWIPGEAGAVAQWETFVDERLGAYAAGRDFPHQDTISSLSPYVSHGEISVRAVWHEVRCRAESESSLRQTADAFLRQLIWRDFAYHQLLHFPGMLHSSLRCQFESFPWEGTADQFAAWKQGRTGYPLVDAGMRQLQETGFIHNRVRMVAASFLVKHLLIPWTAGSDWFGDRLIDFDAANNAMGWQWVTGSGIDAAPYFRIFNPIIQSEKFDANGFYIRRWLPELGKLPAPYIHHPWTASDEVLAEADIRLGEDYPYPMIDHAYARKRALEAYDTVKGKA